MRKTLTLVLVTLAAIASPHAAEDGLVRRPAAARSTIPANQ